MTHDEAMDWLRAHWPEMPSEIEPMARDLMKRHPNMWDVLMLLKNAVYNRPDFSVREGLFH